MKVKIFALTKDTQNDRNAMEFTYDEFNRKYILKPTITTQLHTNIHNDAQTYACFYTNVMSHILTCKMTLTYNETCIIQPHMETQNDTHK